MVFLETIMIIVIVNLILKYFVIVWEIYIYLYPRIFCTLYTKCLIIKLKNFLFKKVYFLFWYNLHESLQMLTWITLYKLHILETL